MDYDKILELKDMLGISGRYRISTKWVMFSCPFAQWTHAGGTDRRPSFGISVDTPSGYHCFTCGKKGFLKELPLALKLFTKTLDKKLLDFILKNDKAQFKIQRPFQVNSVMPAIPYSLFSKYNRAKPFKHLTEEEMEFWDVRYNNNDNMIMFPIFDRFGRLVGVRGRNNHKFKSYTDWSPVKQDPKSYGIWYGDSLPVIPKKPLVLTEGERDVILLKRIGISNPRGSLGASISSAQMERLKHQRNPLLLVFDNDEAGRRARDAVIKACKKIVSVSYFKDYYGCKDAAELVEKGLEKLFFRKENIIRVS